MLTETDLLDVDPDLALRIIAHAITIAPGLDNLATDSRQYKMTIAILKNIAADAKLRGSRLIKGQRVGPASVDYTAVDSWFSDDDKNALRVMGGAAAAGGPIGQFPKSGIVAGVWPEQTTEE